MGIGPGIKGAVVLAALVIIFTGMRLAAPIMLPLMFATFLAIVSLPLIAALDRRGLPLWLSVSVALLVDLGALTGAAALVGTSINSFNARLPEYQGRLVVLIRDVSAWLEGRGLHALAQESDLLDPGVVLGVLGTMVRGAAGILTTLLLVFVLLAFILVEAAGLRHKLRTLVGEDQEQLRRFAAGATQVQRYLMVKSVASLATGIVAGLAMWVLGVDLPLVWGLLAFVLNYVPAIGSAIAAFPPVLVALLMQGPGSALTVAGTYLAINVTIGNVIEPRVLGKALGLSPLVVLLSVVFWGFILGPAGALLSVPLTVVVKILLANSADLAWLAILLGPSRIEPGQAPIPLGPGSSPEP